MDLRTEPVRGSAPPRGFNALPGIDRARAYVYGLVPYAPVAHLTGVRVTQVGPGSAVTATPATPWLAHANGQRELTMLSALAMNVAALTVVEAGRILVHRTHSYAQVRLISSRSVSFVGRAEVVRSTELLTFCRTTLEDSDGRLIAHATGAIESVEDPDPAEPIRLEPYDPPRYTTPDPYERPVPLELTRVFDALATDPVSTVRAIASGELPQGPLASLLGIAVVEGDRGRVVSELTTSGWHVDTTGRLGSGYVDEGCFATAGTAACSLLEDETIGVLSFDVRHFAAPPADGRVLRCAADADRHGDYLSAAGEVRDGADLVSRFSLHAIALPTRRRAAVQRSERKLASVLFTDIVASTATSERLGDSRWAQVLDEHHAIVRRCIADLGGRAVKTTGDGFLATFDSPTDAIRCASAVRSAVRGLGIDIKAGVHSGEVDVRDGDVSGVAVNVASRVLDIAGPGEILVTRTVRDLVAGSEIALTDRGTQSAKGISEDIHLYALS